MLNMRSLKWKLQKRISCATVKSFCVFGWSLKDVTIQMKDTKAYFPMVVFQNFDSVDEILSVLPFKEKVQRRTIPWYCFKLSNARMKTKMCHHLNENYKALLSHATVAKL